jgi:hypothetical protein
MIYTRAGQVFKEAGPELAPQGQKQVRTTTPSMQNIAKFLTNQPNST